MVPTIWLSTRKNGHSHGAFWPEETTGGGNGTGRPLTVDSGVFNTALMANRPEAGAVWATTRPESDILFTLDRTVCGCSDESADQSEAGTVRKSRDILELSNELASER
jgi:hypothetical protein